MSCYYPLKAFVLGTNPETNKKIIKVVSKNYDGNEFSSAGFHQIGIPCGNCIGCRLDYSRTWADRMLLEASYYKNNIFLTLTYNDDNLPPKKAGSPIHSLVKRDMQLFMKRLRKEFPDQKIRFFCAGEYGSVSMRPHYHLILFNCSLPDLKLLRENHLGQPYFVSDTISKLWNKGFHIIANVNWETCAYVARYVVKKQKGVGSSVYDKYNFEPEFSTMSRKPGIARDFYEDHKEEMYAYGSMSISTKDGAKVIKPPKYYDTLFDIEYPEVMSDIKTQREAAAIEYNKIRSSLTNLNYIDILNSADINKNASVRSLKRKGVL